MGLIIITGANGALGINLNHLIKKQQKENRKSNTIVGIDYNRFDCEIGDRIGDLTNKIVLDRIRQLVAARSKLVYDNDCTIINCAASLKLSSDDNIQTINTELPKFLQRVCQEYSARLIHISSCSIYEQPNNPRELIKESFPVKPTSKYETSKILADEYLIKNNKGETVILRPGLIYGGGTRHLGAALAAIPSILKANNINKIPRILGGPRTNWIHVHDLARAICVLLEQEPRADVYNIVEPAAPTFGYVTTEVCRLGGLKISRIPVVIPRPKYFKKYINKVIKNDFVFNNVNFFLKMFSKDIGPGDLRFFLPKEGLNLTLEKEMCTYLEGNMMFDGSLFKDQYFFSNKYNILTGWEEAMDWYEVMGWIDHV